MHLNSEPENASTIHPVALTVLFLPFGMASGYVTVTLAYLLSHTGVSIERIAGLAALQLLPQTWKALWAPLIDTTLPARQWYFISTVFTGLTILALALVPEPRSHFWLLQLLVLLSSIASTFSGMATEFLMAHSTTEHEKGRAGGWSQAGNLGGSGLGGGLALWMSQHSTSWSGGALLALICVLCTLALVPFRNVRHPRGPEGAPVAAVTGVIRDVWAIARTRTGLLTLLLLLLPLSTGAASGLWSAVADSWHASADMVALVNGVLGGIIAMVGCLIAGYLCDVMDRKLAYALFGGVQAICAVAMALAARTPASFVLFTCAYTFLSGCIWAAFSAVALETIGKRSAATNYNLLACVANIPITYMTIVDGSAAARWGPSGMLFTEAALCVLALGAFALAAMAARARPMALASATGE